MPTTVGATMSSIRRSSSVTRALFLPEQVSRLFGSAGLPKNEKSGFLAHSFLFGSSREPDEDGADISAVWPKGKEIRRVLWPAVQIPLLVVVDCLMPIRSPPPGAARRPAHRARRARGRLYGKA